MCDDFSTPYGALLDVTFGIKTTKSEGIDRNGIKYYNVLFVIEGNWDIFVAGIRCENPRRFGLFCAKFEL